MRRVPAPGDLPGELTSFVGREAALGLVNSRLVENRLVSLVGPGGCGKTRLGVQVGRQALESLCSVYFVDLSGLSDPTLVPSAVLDALGLREAAGLDPLEVLVSQLMDQVVLILLDNCEHVVSACAVLAHAILRSCPGARLLATSRQPLGVMGESVVAVDGLQLPEGLRDGDRAWLERSEAGRLFLDRARMARASFRAEEADAVAIARICQQLDGIPLALELAAARARLMSVGAIAGALSDRFRLLVGGDGTGPARHKTLLASIEWSCGLLGAGERHLLHRLSVFAAGFTLAAAETICTGGDVGRDEVLELLTSLVDKSLVQALPVEDRFRLHETMRAYGASALESAGEIAAVRDRHLDYFTELAKAMGPKPWAPEFSVGSAVLRRDLDNVRAALDWSVESKQFAAGAELMGALGTFFYLLGLHSEAGSRCEAFLAVDLAPSQRADVLNCAARCVRHRDPALSLRLAYELVALGRAHGGAATLARGLVRVATSQMGAEAQEALEAASEAVTLARETGQEDIAVYGLWTRAWALVWLGRAAEGLLTAEEALRVAQEVDWAWGVGFARTATSAAARYTGNLSRALEEAENLLQLSAQLDPGLVASGEALRAEALVCLGRPGALDAVTRARAIVEKTLDLYHMANYQACEGRLRASLGMEDAYEVLIAGNAKMEAFQCSAMCVNNRAVLAEVALGRGDIPAAHAHLNASSWRLPREADPAGVPVLRAEARLERADGQLRRAHATASEGLAAAFRAGALLWVVDLLELVAITCADLGRHSEAARLLGAAARQRETTGYAPSAPARNELGPVLADLQAALGPRPFGTAELEGRGLTIEQAVAYARRGQGHRRRAVTGWESLTPAERRVVELVAQHLTNAEIAQQLFVSVATVKSHLTRVFPKFAVRDRRQLAAVGACQDLP